MFNRFEITPADVLLGGLSVVAAPLVRGEDSEEMRETAQFYGYEDWGDCFKCVSGRGAELTLLAPTQARPDCEMELKYGKAMLPGAVTRAVGRWTKMMKMMRVGAREWRGNGLRLVLEKARREEGMIVVRAVLARAD